MSNPAPSMDMYCAPAFADFNPEHAALGPTPERLAHLDEHGFVIINDFVDSPWIAQLREAGRRLTEACAPEVPPGDFGHSPRSGPRGSRRNRDGR